MKITAKLLLIILLSQFTVGCGKAEPEEGTSPEAAVTDKTEQATPSAEANAKSAQSEQASQETQTPAEPAAEQANLPTAAPLKGLQWVKNGPVTFEPGKVYIVEFWATWCGPCKVSIPHLTDVQKKYKDKGVTIIGISTEEPKTVKPFVQKMGEEMDYAVAVDVEGFMQKNYMDAFNKQGIPQAFLINKAGKIVWEGHPLDDLDRVLEMVVQGRFDPVAYAKQKTEEAALQQQVMDWFREYFQKVETAGLTEETKQISSNFIENAPPDGLNAFAWNIMTRVQEANRDLEAALKAAQKANQLTEGKDPSILDTLALALFENGNIEEAVKTQQKAVDLVSDYPEAQQELKERLDRYKAALGDAI